MIGYYLREMAAGIEAKLRSGSEDDTARKTLTLEIARLGVRLLSGDGRVAMSGGVARNSGVVRALAAILDCQVSVPHEPDIVGAVGAALIALERTRASQ